MLILILNEHSKMNKMNSIINQTDLMNNIIKITGGSLIGLTIIYLR